jgi:hypothetical protein
VSLWYGKLADAGRRLDELDKQIAKDAGKKGTLTVAQAAALSAAVAQIRSDLGF